MIVWRLVVILALACSSICASPASAQFFMKSHDYSGEPVRGDEPGLFLPLPDATPAELRANVVWSLRAALNVAALGCDFAPILLTAQNYNSVLVDHKAELAGAFSTLEKYYLRKNKVKKAAQTAFDRYQTKVYSGFTTVYAQYNFCQTAGMIGRDAIFTPRGHLGDLAVRRVRELRNSLVARGEQTFGGRGPMRMIPILRMDPKCWKKNKFDYGACPQAY